MRKIVPEDSVLIPSGAQKVFTGKIFDTYQWEQALYDGRPAAFEMLKRPDTVVVATIRDDEILLVEDTQPNRGPRIGLPGGRVDEGEEWLAAAQRELREETGFVCKSWKLALVLQLESKIEWFIAVYVASDIIETHEPELDAGEKIEPSWQNYEAMRQKVVDGDRTTKDLLFLCLACKTAKDVLAMPEFSGMAVDR